MSEEVAPSRKDFEKINKTYSSEEIMDAMREVKNGPLWDKAKKKSEEEYGHIKWPFVMWLYEQMGGQK